MFDQSLDLGAAVAALGLPSFEPHRVRFTGEGGTLSLAPAGSLVTAVLQLADADGNLSTLHRPILPSRIGDAAALVSGTPCAPAQTRLVLRRAGMRGDAADVSSAPASAARLADPLDLERVTSAAGSGTVVWERGLPIVTWDTDTGVHVVSGAAFARFGGHRVGFDAHPELIFMAVLLIGHYVTLRGDAHADAGGLAAQIVTAIRDFDARPVVEHLFSGAAQRIGAGAGPLPAWLVPAVVQAAVDLSVARRHTDPGGAVKPGALQVVTGRPPHRLSTGELRFVTSTAELLVHKMGDDLAYGSLTAVYEGRVRTRRLALRWGTAARILSMLKLAAGADPGQGARLRLGELVPLALAGPPHEFAERHAALLPA